MRKNDYIFIYSTINNTDTRMAKLYFYYSAMNAGKSTTLLQSAHNYKERGMNALILSPSIDTRGGVGTVESRIGLAADAHPLQPNTNVYEFITSHQENEEIHCILIDEAQFLTQDHVQQLVDIVTKQNIPVLTYGLRTDFIGEPFPGSQYLLAWADELVEIKTICECGKKATMNVRIDENGKKVHAGSQIEIGGNDRYIATCRAHFEDFTPLEK